jgi:DnaJ domain
VIQTLFLGLLALVASLFGIRFYTGADPKWLAGSIRRVGGAAAITGALLLLLAGQMLFAFALGLAGVLLITGRLPRNKLGTASQASTRSTSVRTAFLEMTLDHESRAMRGRVLAGVFAGRDLGSLSRPDLLTLLAECRAGEPQSRQLLEAYLDRAWPEWREASRGPSAGAAEQPKTGTMRRNEALEVLGLKPDASDEQIKAAHRNLMKRFHPDQGGSTYLAAKINEAKDILLGRAP